MTESELQVLLTSDESYRIERTVSTSDLPMADISTQKALQEVPNGVSNKVPNEVSNEMSNVPDTTIAILNLIRETPTITRLELASALGLAVKTIQKHITKLKHAGRIQRMGSSTRGGYWQVIK
mgnify:CR=1 FL=1